MSNFTFGHNVFKSRLLHLRQNTSAGGKGLILFSDLLYHCMRGKMLNTVEYHIAWDKHCRPWSTYIHKTCHITGIISLPVFLKSKDSYQTKPHIRKTWLSWRSQNKWWLLSDDRQQRLTIQAFSVYEVPIKQFNLFTVA